MRSVRIRLRAVLPAVLALLLAAAAAPPARAMELAPADREALAAFTLTPEFLASATAMSKEARDTHFHAAPLDAGRAHSLADVATQMDATPGVKALMAKHGLTTLQYLTGMMALAQTVIVDRMAADPTRRRPVDMTLAGATPANLAFLRSHRREVEALAALTGPLN